MYHAFVRRKITNAFAGLSAGNIDAITDEMAPHAVHYFVGSHALSGTGHPKGAPIRRQDIVSGPMSDYGPITVMEAA